MLIHYSTDYVFDGTRTTPYPEDAPTAPLNVYGASKLEGERAIAAIGAHALVLRTSWVYGLRGRNFLLTIRRLAAERDELRDRRRPDRRAQLEPHARRGDGADRRRADCRRSPSARGSITCRATGTASWYDFARAIVGDARRPRIVPITTAEYPTPARRPAYGVLATARFEATFGFALPDWRERSRLRRESRGEPTPRAPLAPERRRAQNANVQSTSLPTDSVAARAGDDDRVHAERDAAQRARSSGSRRASRSGSAPDRAVSWSVVVTWQRVHGLTSFSVDAVDVERVEVVLVVRRRVPQSTTFGRKRFIGSAAAACAASRALRSASDASPITSSG